MSTLRTSLFLSLLTIMTACWMPGAEGGAGKKENVIRLIVRGDDMGSAHSANEAFVKCYKKGVMRVAEVMVPCPWFEEAARLCNENPGLEVGIHLTLTSEWDNVKWRPLTHAPSIMNADGYFYQMTSSGWPRNAKWPKGTAFLDADVQIADVEKELRAQIKLGKKKIKNVTHLTSHMGTPTCRPELRELVERLAKEYGLVTGAEAGKRGLKHAGSWSASAGRRPEALATMLKNLGPGTWLIIEHPGLDTPEMQAMGHKGYDDVASSRQGVTQAFTSPAVKKVIKERGIQLIRYADLK